MKSKAIWLKAAGAAAVAALALLVSPQTASAEEYPSASVYIDGQLQQFDPSAKVIKDRTMVPLRAIFEKLGAAVEWDQATQTVTGTKSGTTIRLQIGSAQATINQTPVTLDVPAQMYQDRTLVPLRFISEALGAEVAWDGDFASAYIHQKDGLTGLYVSSDGVRYETTSTAWDTGKLRRLDNIFQHNLRGEELAYLSKIVLSPEKPGSKVGEIDLRWNYLPDGSPYSIQKGRTITLYYANELNTPEDQSFTLSHEYGHLFSFHWIIKKEKKLPGYSTTGWAALRNLSSFPIVWRGSNLTYSHFWSPEEIMADEYAVLFGAKEGKRARVPYDPAKLFALSYADRIENKLIPSSESAEGVRNYWLQLSGLSQNVPAMPVPTLQKAALVDQSKFGHTAKSIKIQFATGPYDTNRNIKYWASLSTKKNLTDKYWFFSSEVVTSGDIYLGGIIDAESYWPIPTETGFIQIFAMDEATGQLIYSQPYWFDFSTMQPVQNQFH